MEIVKDIIEKLNYIQKPFIEDKKYSKKFEENYEANVIDIFSEIKLNLANIGKNKKTGFSIIHDELSKIEGMVFAYFRQGDKSIIFNNYSDDKYLALLVQCKALRYFIEGYLLKDINEKSKSVEESKIEAIDLSESKGTEKIIMLEKLGILKFLREQEPFIRSTNSLASAISGFSGIGITTVQSYINPINNPTASQKNNPLKKDKSVKKVIQNLTSIGFYTTK